MKCNACATLNSDDNKFCENCGDALLQRCPSCHRICSPQAKFCGDCGCVLRTLSVVPVTASANWGELKSATIMFADIVRSTEHIADLDPEQVMTHLRPAVLQMCDAVESFGGTVIRTLGDGVMAIFGVPHALEGHSRLACEAALAMQDSFEHNPRLNPQALRIRIGLHAGQVALDPRASDALIGGGLYGHAIHLASRVVALAAPGGVCITGACLALIQSAGTVVPMGAHQLKGIPEPTDLFVLTAMHNETAAAHFHQIKLSPLQGRQEELAALGHALHQTLQGQGSVVALSGPPGMGKSRLCFEFAEMCRSQDVDVFEVRTHPYGSATPLQPVLSVMRTCFFNLQEGDAPAVVRQHIAERLATLIPPVNVVDDTAVLAALFGVTDPDAPESTLGTSARQARLLTLMRDLARDAVRHAPERRPTVIMLEDLHWLDVASESFLSVLVQSVVGVRLMLLVTYRPAYVPTWSPLPQFQAIALQELSTSHIADLVGQRLRPHPGLADAAGLIVERAAGNPFFAEELVQSLLEATARAAALGPEHPSRASALQLAQALPITVQAVIGERIDRLAATQKSLLHICAVIGKEIPLPVLQQVAVFLSKQIDSGLEGLCQAELLYLLRSLTLTIADRRYAFRHPLIQEVAYNTQLKARRIDLHAAVAIAMEAYYRGQSDEYAALIAFHYEAADQPVNAARWEARAAQWVITSNSAQGMERWRKVRKLLVDAIPGHDRDRLLALACGQIALLGWREGLPPSEVERLVEEAMTLAAVSDHRLVQLLMLVRGRMLIAAGGSADGYVSHLREALELGGSDTGRMAMLNLVLSHAYSCAGLLREGLAANDMARQNLRNISKFDREFMGVNVELWQQTIRVRLLTRMGRFDEAEACLHHASTLTGAQHDPMMALIVHCMFIDHAWFARKPPLALAHVDEVVRIAAAYPNPYSQVFTHICVGQTQWLQRDVGQALASFTASLNLLRQMQVALDFEADVLTSMAECHLERGELHEALALAQEAVTVAQKSANRATECRSRLVWKSVMLRDSAFGGAAEVAAQSAHVSALLVQTHAHAFSLDATISS